MSLNTITALLCMIASLRLILYTRAGATHRPWASLLAYLLIVAFTGCAVLLAINHQPISWPQFILNLVFVSAVISTSGNVVALFRPASTSCQPLILRLLRREKWL